MSSRLQPASTGQILLRTLSSLSHLILGDHLRMQSLQLTLHSSWDRVEDSTLVRWDDHCRHDLLWWLDPVCLQEGLSQVQVSPDLNFWSDACDVGWGTHLSREVISGQWSREESTLSINARELLVVERGLLHFQSLVCDSTVSIFADNSTAVAYLRKSWSTRSPSLNTIAQQILRWAEFHSIILTPQFIMGRNNVLADALSRPNQIQDLEWTLKMVVFFELWKQWPVMVDLFATSANHRCSLYFSPFHDPQALGTDAVLHSWDNLQVYAFPPWALIPQVLRSSGSPL